jgi:predicted Rossmann fold flavoprotein
MRVFPVSDNGKDVVGAFEKIFEQYTVNVHFREGVKSLEYRAQTQDYKIQTDKGEYDFAIVVLTTGGNAYAHTGSSWEWYDLARAVWHSITPLWPSLNSFMTSEPWMHELSWLSFPNAKLRYSNTKDGTFKDAYGPVLLTHFGISGPATFIFAAYTAFEIVDKEHVIIPFLQPLADMDTLIWNKFLQDASVRSPKKQLSTILAESPLSKRFAAAFVQCYSKDIPIGQVPKQERQDLASLLWYGIPVICTQRKPWDEFVTAGGVSLDEVNSSTLESKIVPWLYFAGEILDVDGVTGGFNLQACWSAGYVVGKSIVTAISW